MRTPKEMQRDLEENVALAVALSPLDHARLKQAEKTHGHITPKAVGDEYDRLMLVKVRARWSAPN
jgi:hypothetical protein